jgi:hypothetical protein
VRSGVVAVVVICARLVYAPVRSLRFAGASRGFAADQPGFAAVAAMDDGVGIGVSGVGDGRGVTGAVLRGRNGWIICPR